MPDYVVPVDYNDVVELLDLVDVALMPVIALLMPDIIEKASQRAAVRLPEEPIGSDRYQWVLLREVEDILVFGLTL